MNKSPTKYKLIILVAFVAIAIWVYVARPDDTHKKMVFNKDEITLVSTLKDPDGSVLGDIYVAYTKENVFTSLYISKQVDGKNIVVYKINSQGFFNTAGKELDVSESKFYGYKFSRIESDYFIVYLLTNGGKNVSDDFTIEWNDGKRLFEIQRPHASDLLQQ